MWALIGVRTAPCRLLTGRAFFMIAILSGYTNAQKSIGELTYGSKLAYALRWKRPLINFIEPSFDFTRPPAWSKIQFMLGKLSSFEYVYWLDADILITNNEIDIDTYATVDIIGSQDKEPVLNTGSFLVKNSTYGRAILLETWKRKQYIHTAGWEQAALHSILVETNWHNTCLLPQHCLNSYPATYKKGDLLVHFAGLTNEEKVCAIRKYL